MSIRKTFVATSAATVPVGMLMPSFAVANPEDSAPPTTPEKTTEKKVFPGFFVATTRMLNSEYQECSPQLVSLT